MSSTLMHNSLRYLRMASQRVEATAIAQSTMDEIRAWAWQTSAGTHNYHSDWSTYRGVVRPVAGYRVRMDASPGSVTLASPCTTLETVHGANARFLRSSVVPVRVQVEWDPPIRANRVTLVSYVGEPPRTIQSVTVTRGGSGDPVPRNAQVDFAVEASDPQGRVIEDLMFRWYVEPTGVNPGLATLFPPWGPPLSPAVPPGARDGSATSLKNTVRLENGSWGFSPGSVRVRARARLHGLDSLGETTAVMAP